MKIFESKPIQIFPSDFLHLEERPERLLKGASRRVDLPLAELHEAARAQRGLQLLGAFQEGRFRDNLADVDDMSGGLLGARLPVLQRYQPPAELKKKKKKRVSQTAAEGHGRSGGKEELTANEAPTGLRIHLGGFFRGV